MDTENPAVANKTLLSPYDIECIQEDPSKLEVVARAMGAVNLDNLFRQMQDPTLNPNTKIEFQKMLNKMGRLEPDTKTAHGDGPQVIINITRARDRDDAITIEGTACAEPLELPE